MSGHLDLDSLYTLGKSVTKDIPGIAYTIPDLMLEFVLLFTTLKLRTISLC